MLAREGMVKMPMTIIDYLLFYGIALSCGAVLAVASTLLFPLPY